MHKYFFAIFQFAAKNKFRFYGIVMALLIFLGFFASKISFQENITQLIPSNDQAGVTSRVLDQVNFADKITIIITRKSKGTPEDLTLYASQFLDSVEASCKPYVSKIQGRIDEKNIQETFDFVYENLPLFLDQDDYKLIHNKIQPDSIASIVEGDYKTLIAPTGIVSRDFILKDPLGISFIALKKLQQLSVGDDFELQNGFILTKDKKNLLLFLTPKLPTNETDQNTLFIKQLDKIKSALDSKFSGKVTMTYFGATPVAVANATQIKADVQNTMIFAALTLIIILIFFYKNLSTPLIIFIPSLFGALFALALLYFMKGTISAISLGISSILLGETTDYSIYVLTHLRNNKNVKLLYKDLTKPMILCGTTTAITFLCLFFVKSEALKDLGIFAAITVISTSIFSLLLIPLLYKIKNEKAIPRANVIDKLGAYPYHKNKLLIAAVFVMLILSLFNFSKVTFNNDLSALNFMTSDLRKAEHDLENIANISSKSIYLATYGDSQEAVLKTNTALFDKLKQEKDAHQILNYSSIGGILLSKEQQAKKIQEWKLFWNEAAKTELKAKLISNGNKFGFKPTSFAAFYETLDKQFNPISVDEYAKVKSFFLEEFIAQKNGFYTISTLVKVPNDKRDVFVNEIKKQSNLVIIDRQQTNETFLGALKKNFEDLVDYSFIAIFFILLLAFKRIELVIVSIIPIMVSWLFTTGLMGMFGLQFNIINIIVCTLVFGIGVDYSIFMTTALQKEHTYGKSELPSYKTSIVLSVMTTILGIGVMIFAKHPALKSISIIAIIGIFSALLITFIVQPLVFSFFATSRTKKGKAPFRFFKLIHSSLSFTYYGLGGFLLSIISATMMKILPLPKKTKLKMFHYVMSKFMLSVLMSNPALKRKIINTQKETFDKPAIIIANHTSFLDILAVGLLSPKIIFLVSDWVYNSPIFGKGVRLAGFYPVSSGIDNGIEHLKAKVEQGFSLMVFPEGSRSVDNSIKRFHKGAFYLAEQLNLDIIPIVIHGYSEVLPKGDFIINGRPTTVEILNRISPSDPSLGTDYTERTKAMSTFFKSHFKKMRDELEGPDYFKKIIIDSFDFKENEVIKSVKADLDLNLDLYYKLKAAIPSKAKVLHYADDYGQLDLLLALQQSQRKTISLISDQNKRAVAESNYIVKKRAISYPKTQQELINNNYDVILLSDKNLTLDNNQIIQEGKVLVLIGVSNLKNSLLELGYEIEHEEDNLIVLRKK